MPITINGSGTIEGIVPGGLPDGSVVANDIAAGAVTAPKLASGSAASNLVGSSIPGSFSMFSLISQGSQRRIRTYELNNYAFPQNSSLNLMNNAGQYTDVHFILTLEAFHSGRSYQMWGGTFGGYGLNVISIGGTGSFSLSSSTISDGFQHLRVTAGGLTGGGASLNVHMTIFGDSAITVSNGVIYE